MSESLNPNQRRRLRITCEYVDKLLSDLEAALNESASKSPFPRYLNDISPAQRRSIEDYIARIREQMVRVLAGQNISIEPPRIPVSRVVDTGLNFVGISLEELRPRHMKGYGEVSPVAAAELNRIVGELQALLGKLQQSCMKGRQRPG
jgi:hypothetical protein